MLSVQSVVDWFVGCSCVVRCMLVVSLGLHVGEGGSSFASFLLLNAFARYIARGLESLAVLKSSLMSHPAAPWRSLLSVSSGSLDLRSSHGLQGSLLGSATRLL